MSHDMPVLGFIAYYPLTVLGPAAALGKQSLIRTLRPPLLVRQLCRGITTRHRDSTLAVLTTHSTLAILAWQRVSSTPLEAESRRLSEYRWLLWIRISVPRFGPGTPPSILERLAVAYAKHDTP